MNVVAILKDLLIKSLPVRKNRVVFTSYDGDYCDSPAIIANMMSERNTNLEIIFLVHKKYTQTLNKTGNIKFVNIDSLRAVFCIGTAKILVDNVYGHKEVYLYSNSKKAKILFNIKTWLKNKKQQRVYTLWHGTPIKKMGRDQVGSSVFDFSCPNTTMILDNKYAENILSHLTYGKIPIKLLGSPRNDILVDLSEYDKKKILNELGIPPEKKVVLFAPSFRTKKDGTIDVERSGLAQMDEIDFEKIFKTLKKKFGGDWVLICRFHYYVANLIDWDSLSRRYEGKIINGNKHQDMRYYLACSDILISDMSSCIFDFMQTLKPTFIYFPDMEYYSKNERGLYLDIMNLPIGAASSFDKLLDLIRLYNEEKYIQGIRQLRSKLGYIKRGKVSEKVIKYILEQDERL